MLLKLVREAEVCREQSCIHRSLLVSISPNSSRLPPLLEVAAEVAEAAEVVEKAAEGLLTRTGRVGVP
jgi:hypothetical protein